MDIQRIGLIAGNGRFPILFVKAAKTLGIKVFVAAIRGDTSLLLNLFSDEIKWFKVSQLQAAFSYFKENDVKYVMMAGQVSQRNLFDPAVQADQEFHAFFSALQDRKADTIFGEVVEILNKNGLEVLDSTLLIKKFLAPKGTLTRRGPTKDELEDMEFGKTIAKAIGGLDIGQTVVVKGKAVLAIEAMEGTDRCVVRGGRIAQRGAVVIKTSKPAQDLRFDVPVVGPRTIQQMMKTRCSCLGIESNKTLIIDRERCIALANKAKICIVSS
jgi:hypothetical protein